VTVPRLGRGGHAPLDAAAAQGNTKPGGKGISAEVGTIEKQHSQARVPDVADRVAAGLQVRDFGDRFGCRRVHADDRDHAQSRDDLLGSDEPGLFAHRLGRRLGDSAQVTAHGVMLQGDSRW
jgi:hypothetical protein